MVAHCLETLWASTNGATTWIELGSESGLVNKLSSLSLAGGPELFAFEIARPKLGA